MEMYACSKKYALFYLAGKRFFLNIYEVITWERLQRKLCQSLLRRCGCMRVHVYVNETLNPKPLNPKPLNL